MTLKFTRSSVVREHRVVKREALALEAGVGRKTLALSPARL